ncbi:VOC family protein [Leptospira licerasiae]|uniref:Glyoxalase-like domain protein n=1 Tax=Leptospira licerasiae str. MMD4847 TaxID=1049971 RepID=A0ABP2RBA4_9LEPT|nr:VOC family protein [Leptospira licerasiae]EIE00810.1 glyoxalase-like domain protein [Leptospira licerasiae serovar Varillal str. VAR 010]EJZ40481.1 glyoxalase-like domain protein [Leptospira licerasiae str. MMD4847]
MRPFKILGVQQIAVGGDSKDKLKKFWVDTLGLQNIGSFRSEKENVDEDILQMGKGPYAVEVDIMEPVDPTKSPRVNDPKLNHIGLWVDDIHKAVEWLSSQGVRFTPGGIRKGAGGHEVTFIHPKGNEEFPLCGEGVLIELVQAPKDVIDALG